MRARSQALFGRLREAPSDARKVARDVRIEGYTLEVWGEYFEIHQAEEQGSEELKIESRGPRRCTVDSKRGILFPSYSRI